MGEVIEDMFDYIAYEKYPDYFEVVDEELDKINVVAHFPEEVDSFRSEEEREASLQLEEILKDEEVSPEKVVELSATMVKKYPWNEIFYNALAEGYQRAEQNNELQLVMDEMLEKFPDSVFVKIRKALSLLSDGRSEDVALTFGGNENLYSLLPDRKEFNAMEVIGFHTVMTICSIEKRNVLNALVHYTIVEEMENEFYDADNPLEEGIYLELLILKTQEVMAWVKAREV